jgi:hypothetical protein
MMEKLEHQYGADALSEALEVSESGFAAHRGKQNGQRWKEDAELRVLIAQSFEESRKTYGSPRVRLDLRELGHRCGKNRVESAPKNGRQRLNDLLAFLVFGGRAGFEPTLNKTGIMLQKIERDDSR